MRSTPPTKAPATLRSLNASKQLRILYSHFKSDTRAPHPVSELGPIAQKKRSTAPPSCSWPFTTPATNLGEKSCTQHRPMVHGRQSAQDTLERAPARKMRC